MPSSSPPSSLGSSDAFDKLQRNHQPSPSQSNTQAFVFGSGSKFEASRFAFGPDRKTASTSKPNSNAASKLQSRPEPESPSLAIGSGSKSISKPRPEATRLLLGFGSTSVSDSNASKDFKFEIGADSKPKFKKLKPRSRVFSPHASNINASASHANTFASLDPELALLQLSTGPHDANNLEHATRNAPIFSGEVSKRLPGRFPQRSVLGSIISQHAHSFPEKASDPKLYLNVNTPFSALICGLQGSGKSHSASVILEGCLLVDNRIGTLPKPLSALSLHYDVGSVNHPCEPAYLSMPTRSEIEGMVPVVPVTVLVSPTCLQTMKKIYAPLKRVTVLPFYLSTANLNSSRMLSLMGFDSSVIMPLYLQRAMTILRQMGADKFNYYVFKRRMDAEDLNHDQKSSFQMRIEMLDSYLTGKASADIASYFKPGHLVIVDLRDPFTTTSLVISLFEIVVGLFVELKMDTGKILLLDEAHKYLNSDASSARFTESITSLIRQQRHFGIRTIISTQEPTVVPNAILELVSFLILHRFTSPAWVKHLSRHVSVDDKENANQPWPITISTLGLGEAVLVSPSALSVQTWGDSIAPLATGYLIIRTRKRLTYDGGVSIVACN